MSGFIDARTGRQPDASAMQRESYILNEHGMLVPMGTTFGSGAVRIGRPNYADGWNKAKMSRGTNAQRLSDLSRDMAM